MRMDVADGVAMMPAPFFEPTEHRVSINCPQLLGCNAECIVRGRSVILHDEVAGSIVSLSSFDFVEWKGRTLRFRSRSTKIPKRGVEFAGLGRDAWFDVTCPDESTAATLVDLIGKPFGRMP
jgi:hypothetical protein